MASGGIERMGPDVDFIHKTFASTAADNQQLVSVGATQQIYIHSVAATWLSATTFHVHGEGTATSTNTILAIVAPTTGNIQRNFPGRGVAFAKGVDLDIDESGTSALTITVFYSLISLA